MLIPFSTLFNRFRVRGVKKVLHVGANEGQEAAEYSRLGIKHVVWVEAHRPTFEKLVRNIHTHLGRLHAMPTTIGEVELVPGNGELHYCVNACVAEEDGRRVTFNVANNGAQSSSFLEFGTHSKEHPTVKFVDRVEMITKRLDTILRELGMEFDRSFLNMDLQGAEFLALVGLGNYLDQFDHVYLEVNEAELYKGCVLVGELDKWLADRGLQPKQVKMTGSGWGDKFYQRWA